ncbi:MAG TPA: cadherin-like beta sandwich domain-containing protein [Gemmatimonadales bacterium]|jgi:hypothetical protein|nr:cadherin-like beta sandwich domain-containing protein [Gemmatimonadales bacterium]
MRVFTALAAVLVAAGCSNYGTGSQSSDNNLSALVVTGGTLAPAFSSATTTYTVAVTNDITLMVVTPTTSNVYATVRVNGAVIQSGTPSPGIALAVGDNLITVAVTAEAGGSARVYNITVTRAP